MNIVYLLLLCYLIFIVEAIVIDDEDKESSSDDDIGLVMNNNYNRYDHPFLPLLQVKMRMRHRENSQVNLKLTNRVLANENLPIWILRKVIGEHVLNGENNYKLKRDYKVMKQLGPFTIYQEPETSSAAVYFHERREFDGMIGYDVIIHELSIDIIHPTDETEIVLNKFGVYLRPGYEGHEDNFQLEEHDPDAGIINNQNYRKTYNNHVYDGYPEVLVIVSWDLARHRTINVNPSDWYTTIVSYVLTLFNGVDMLYAKLQEPKIQINIAGIIIATEEESISFLKKCFVDINGKESSVQHLELKCTIAELINYLEDRKEIIPMDSYDAAIFITREVLVESSDDEYSSEDTKIVYDAMHGLARTIDDLYRYRRDDEETLLIAVIKDNGYLGNYPVIAHEISHLMTANHDIPPVFTNTGECCGKLMKLNGDYWCNRCLSWSETSADTFTAFFSSPNCCSFINKPRSLLPSGRHQLLTGDEQCQCYGYKSVMDLTTVIYTFKRFCEFNLICRGENNYVHQTVIPMDGTPCADNMVCWQRNCQKIEIFTTS